MEMWVSETKLFHFSWIYLYSNTGNFNILNFYHHTPQNTSHNTLQNHIMYILLLFSLHSLENNFRQLPKVIQVVNGKEMI